MAIDPIVAEPIGEEVVTGAAVALFLCSIMGAPVLDAMTLALVAPLAGHAWTLRGIRTLARRGAPGRRTAAT